MISKKLFYISNLVFSLPDNFNGNYTDALEEIIKYRRSQEAIQNREYGEVIQPGDLSLEDHFQMLNEKENNRLSFDAGFSFFENGEWINKYENKDCD